MGKHRDGIYFPYIFVLFVTEYLTTDNHTQNTSVKIFRFFFVWLRDTVDRAEANDVTTTPRQEQVGSMRRNEREKLPVHTSAVLGVL